MEFSMEKKHLFFTIFFYVFIMFIITKFGENFEQKLISASFKMFRTKS